MLTFYLALETDEYKIFLYFPEGKELPGAVVFYLDGRRDIISESPSDFKGYYLVHAFSGILKQERKRGIVAWC